MLINHYTKALAVANFSKFGKTFLIFLIENLILDILRPILNIKIKLAAKNVLVIFGFTLLHKVLLPKVAKYFSLKIILNESMIPETLLNTKNVKL